NFASSFTLTLAVIPLLIFFGIVAGLVSILFAVVLMATRNFFTVKLPDWADPVVGSIFACIVILIVSILVGSDLTIAGMGYDVINTLAENTVPISVLIILLLGKLFASSFVVAGKVSGGVLASSLFVGAMLGAIFGEIFFPGQEAAFIVLGMGAVLAANTNTPVATTIMMLEMSLSFDLVIPLVLVVSVSYLVSGGTSLYAGQKVSRDDESKGYYSLVNIISDGSLRTDSQDDTSNLADELPATEGDSDEKKV
ncbi:MAG: chloride channel protein, partial [Candidatus Thorarchaeota archaeon]